MWRTSDYKVPSRKKYRINLSFADCVRTGSGINNKVVKSFIITQMHSDDIEG